MNRWRFTKSDGGRLVAGVSLVALSLLLLGASRVTQELRKRLSNGKTDKLVWKTMMAEMTGELPIEHRTAWRDVCNDHPRLLLKMNTVDFTAARGVDRPVVAMNE